jgi:hypothetical protein
MTRTTRIVAAAVGLTALALLDVFLRRTLEHSDKFLYAFIPYFYPEAEKVLFHGSYPVWKLLLPIPSMSGAWSASLIITHVVEMRIGVAPTWYLFNVLLLVGSFAAAWMAFESLAFAFTFAIAMAFGTHFYHTYTISGGMASPLIALALECLMLCSYKVIVADRHRRWWIAGFAASLVAAALSYEGWLDFVAFAVVGSLILAVLLARRNPVAVRRMLGVTGAIVAVAVIYVLIKTRFGYGQVQGSESDVVFQYPYWAPAIEDVASNVLTHLYIALTNFLPPVFLSSSALFSLGADRLVALQYGYHADYSYLVPMHYLFLWRYAAGAAAVITAYVFVTLCVRVRREPTANRIAALVGVAMMIMAGSTHTLIKIRPMKTTPVLGYHVLVGVTGAAILIAWGVMVLWRNRRVGAASKVAVTACVWGVIFYGSLARPIMLNHMAAEVGLPGLYPNPMNSLRVMLGLPESTVGDLSGYRLMKYSPPAPSSTPAPSTVADAAPPPLPRTAAASPTLGEAAGVTALPTRMMDVINWDRLNGVKVTRGASDYLVESNSSGGYQLMSPPITVPPMKRVLGKASGRVERGRICFGVLDGSQQTWLHAPSAPESEIFFDTGAFTAVRLVFTTCADSPAPPVFHVSAVTLGVLEPLDHQ